MKKPTRMGFRANKAIISGCDHKKNAIKGTIMTQMVFVAASSCILNAEMARMNMIKMLPNAVTSSCMLPKRVQKTLSVSSLRATNR